MSNRACIWLEMLRLLLSTCCIISALGLQYHVSALPTFTADIPTTLNVSTPANPARPDFERLTHVGVANLLRVRPAAGLLMVAAVPLNDAHFATDYQRFRQVALIAYDRTDGMYLRMCNTNDGRNIWNVPESFPERPPQLITLFPFAWNIYPVSMQRAFQILRNGGVATAWRSVTVRPYEVWSNQIAYVFTVGSIHSPRAAVNAHTGEWALIEQDALSSNDEDGFPDGLVDIANSFRR